MVLNINACVIIYFLNIVDLTLYDILGVFYIIFVANYTKLKRRPNALQLNMRIS